MQLGLGLPIEDVDGVAFPYADIRTMAVAAEDAGLDSIWVYDHLLFRFDGEDTGIHECWTVLSALAEATQRVKLGTLVMCTEYRNPALLAKMAATLDHISDGRMILGIGCGWHDPEYEAFGYPTDHKVSRFDDSIAIIHELLRTGRSDHRGRFHEVHDVRLLPPARPDLPILVAAKRPRMLDLTARYADAWNLAWFGAPDERLRTTRTDLEAACERAGRDPSSIDITVGVEVRFADVATSPPEGSGLSASPLAGDEASLVAGIQAFEAFGADHLIFALDPATPETAARLNAAIATYRRGT